MFSSVILWLLAAAVTAFFILKLLGKKKDRERYIQQYDFPRGLMEKLAESVPI
jgi:hypothetical protein